MGNGQEVNHAPKIFTETAKIDFNRSVTDIHNLIRGLSPFPGAFTKMNGKMLKIFTSEKEYYQTNNGNAEEKNETGTFLTDGKSYLKFAAADGFISVKELQMEGKKRMLIQDFLKGFRI